MEEPKIVTYHDLAKIGIKEIFYHLSGEKGWKHDEKMIETIDGQEWLYQKEDNIYIKKQPKLELKC